METPLCDPANHCQVLPDGTMRCEPGYEWANVDDPNDFTCQEITDPCPVRTLNCACDELDRCNGSLVCNEYHRCKPNMCSCDDTNQCDNGCDCDPDCVVACECDSTSACEASCACDPDCGGGCDCDTTSACNNNCACDPDCGGCDCDGSVLCDKGCNCDPDCARMTFCDFTERTQVGTIPTGTYPRLNEASGLAQSRSRAQVFWSHQDNENDGRVFALNRDGSYLGTWELASSGAISDMEDIAAGPGPLGSKNYLYLGDIGHNFGIWGCQASHTNSAVQGCANCERDPDTNQFPDCQQRNPVVWRMVEPDVDPQQSFSEHQGVAADRIRLALPDDLLGLPQDAEGLMIDPVTKDIYVVLKRVIPTVVLWAPYPQSTTQITTLSIVALIPEFAGATGADISEDGSIIIIRTYDDAWIWERPDGVSVGEALTGQACHVTGITEYQGESVALAQDNSGNFYTTSERGGGPADVPIYLVK